MALKTISKEEILDFLRKNKKLFKKKFAVDEIMLFGSFARDEATENSDIDILIKSNIKSFDKLYRLTVFLEDNLQKKVDVIYMDSVNPFILELIDQEIIYA